MVLKIDNVGIVVEDLDEAIDFFRELGLEPTAASKVPLLQAILSLPGSIW